MKHFHAYELVSPEIYDKSGDSSLGLFDLEALQALDDLRDYFGFDIVVNNWHSGGPFEHRGWRSLGDEMKANPKSKGHSAHQVGKAFDLDVEGMKAEEVRQRIIADKDNPLLRRITRLEGGVSWVHFDVMPLPAGVQRIHIFSS